MELYGFPVAAISHKNPQLIDIKCNPIVVSDTNLETFKVLDDLKFEKTIDLKNPASLTECFVELVNALREVIRRQKKSLGKLEYRQVALHIGQDSRNPVDIDILYEFLFGKKFSAPHSNNKSSLAKDQKTFRAYNDLPKLLDECCLQTGNFTPPNDGPNFVLKQNNDDRKILNWKRQLDEGDSFAYYKLLDFAKNEGRELGLQATKDPEIFAYSAPPGYKDNPKLQAECPVYSFYNWDPSFVEAFHQGFKETYEGPYPRRPKLPIDDPNPPFTDPCADSIRAQFEIIKGRRAPEGIIDQKNQRWQIAESARQVSGNNAKAI